MDEDDGIFNLKRWELGIAGSILVLSQTISHYQLSNSIQDDLNELKQSVQQSQVDRETYFVRKSELSVISTKIDKLTDQVTSLRAFIKTTYNYDAQSEALREDEISCSVEHSGDII